MIGIVILSLILLWVMLSLRRLPSNNREISILFLAYGAIIGAIIVGLLKK